MKTLIAAALLFTSLPTLALTLGAYNIRNFDYDQRYRIHTNKHELARMLNALKADVLSIEEINNAQDFELFIEREMPGYGVVLSRCGGAHEQKLGFIYKKSVVKLLGFEEDLRVSNPGQKSECNSGSRPLGIGHFQINSSGQRFFGITAHFKSGSSPSALATRARQFELLGEAIRDVVGKTGVRDYYVAGDLNTTEYYGRGTDYKILKDFLRQNSMLNLTEKVGCSAYWWGGSDDGIEEPSQLDHVLATRGLVKRSVQAEVHGHCREVSCRKVSEHDLGISYAEVSDHCPITAKIQ